MKTECYILRFGTISDLKELASRALEDDRYFIDSEVDSFIIRAQFAQQMMQERIDVSAELKVINGRLYISGIADGLMFTI